MKFLFDEILSSSWKILKFLKRQLKKKKNHNWHLRCILSYWNRILLIMLSNELLHFKVFIRFNISDRGVFLRWSETRGNTNKTGPEKPTRKKCRTKIGTLKLYNVYNNLAII